MALQSDVKSFEHYMRWLSIAETLFEPLAGKAMNLEWPVSHPAVAGGGTMVKERRPEHNPAAYGMHHIHSSFL